MWHRFRTWLISQISGRTNLVMVNAHLRTGIVGEGFHQRAELYLDIPRNSRLIVINSTLNDADMSRAVEKIRIFFKH